MKPLNFFGYLKEQRTFFEKMGWPIISVDTKHKELIGLFAQQGRLWCDQAQPVYMHDFPSDATGRAVPYGVYDLRHRVNLGYLYVGQPIRRSSPSMPSQPGGAITGRHAMAIRQSC